MPKRSKSVWKRLVAVATKWAENGYGLNSLYEFQACICLACTAFGDHPAMGHSQQHSQG